MERGLPPHIIEIPIEFKSDFENDPVTAYQQFGDTPQESEFPYFENRTAVHAMVDQDRINPINDLREFHNDFRCRDNNYRFIHCDLGWTHDACGISMCYVSDWVKLKVRKVDEESGEFYYSADFRPVFTFDFLCQIKAEGSEIDFAEVRELIWEVCARDFPVLMVTFDRFQSVDMMQILRRGTATHQALVCANLSLDRTLNYPVIDMSKEFNHRKVATGSGQFANLAVWSHGKEAINTGRIKLPFYKPITDTIITDYRGQAKGNVDDFGNSLNKTEYITLVEQEALGATFDKKAMKVKESPKGSIDLLESVLGAAFNASNNVTVREEIETPRQKRFRLAKALADAPTEMEKQEVREEIKEELDTYREEETDNKGDGSIFEDEDNAEDDFYRN